MTKQEILCNKLLKDFPQLEPYAHVVDEGDGPFGDTMHIGLHGDNINASAIIVGRAVVIACTQPAPCTEYISNQIHKSNTIISNLKPHINEMLKMIQDFEKTANPQREFDMLKNLGFERGQHGGTLQVDNTEIRIESPYHDFWISGFNGHLTVREHKSTRLEKYFSTLDELLDYIANGGYAND